MKENERKQKFYDQLRKKEWKYISNFGPSAIARHNIILKLLSKFSKKKESILDVGCGSGDLLKILLQNGYVNIAGSDFSYESIKRSKQQVGDIVFQADITLENSFKHKYDVVICSEVLEHIKDDTVACKVLASLLRSNGTAIISVPVNKKYWSSHDDFSGHIRRYEPDRLESLLIQHGFKVVHSHYWGSGMYSLYHFFLRKMSPTNLMNGKKPCYFKSLVSKIILQLFIIDNYMDSPLTAKRLFVVAKKHPPNSR